MSVRTKIICTMGPSVNSYEKILELIDAGMNVARLNFSHGSHEDHLETIELLKKARNEKNVPLAIMLDTKGPEIRIGKIRPEGVELQPGQRIRLVKDTIENYDDRFQMTPAQVFDNIEIGTKILIDDGYISSVVVERHADEVIVEIQNQGTIKSNKGVNIPNCPIDLPAMTDRDISDIIFGCQNDIDIIAASFIRSEEHVMEIKRLLISQKKPDIMVIAKIESPQGVENFDAIVQVADGIMVARGDLGVEMPLEKVPSLQKMMIASSQMYAKPVVTATQMLESMIKNPRPTRAEVSDVANAIYDGTSAVMLSGETAVGLYPVQTVKIMRSIIKEAEENFDYKEFLSKEKLKVSNDVSSSVSYASVKTAYNSSARAIFAYTSSGFTPRVLSKFRPAMPIIALCQNKKVYHQMSLFWGVISVEPSVCSNQKEAFEKVKNFALDRSFVNYGDLVVITSGSAFGISGSTNTMTVESIGDVLVRGRPGSGNSIHGKIAVLVGSNHLELEHYRDKIVVMSKYNDRFLQVLNHVLGIILQTHPNDLKSEAKVLEIARSQGVPVITKAEGALNQLKEGLLVTMDPKKGIIYNGPLPQEHRNKHSHK